MKVLFYLYMYYKYYGYLKELNKVQKPPFAYEKVEIMLKIGTILIGSRLKDGDLIGFNYRRFEKIKSNNYN